MEIAIEAESPSHLALPVCNDRLAPLPHVGREKATVSTIS